MTQRRCSELPVASASRKSTPPSARISACSRRLFDGLAIGELGVVLEVVEVLPAFLGPCEQPEVGDRSRDVHRPVLGATIPGILGEHHPAQVQLGRHVGEPYRIQVVPGARIGVGGDDVHPRLDVVLVHAPHRVGVVLERDTGPGPVAQRHAHLLELGADRAVEQDDLAVLDALRQSSVFAHVTVLAGVKGAHVA